MNIIKTDKTLPVFWKLIFPSYDKDVYNNSTYFIPAFRMFFLAFFPSQNKTCVCELLWSFDEYSAGPGLWSCPCTWQWWGYTWSLVFNFGSLITRTMRCWSESTEKQQNWEMIWSTSLRRSNCRSWRTGGWRGILTQQIPERRLQPGRSWPILLGNKWHNKRKWFPVVPGEV